MPATGGVPVEVTHLNGPDEASHRFPDFLSDGRHFLFFVAGTAHIQGVYDGSLDADDTRRLLESDSAAVFAQPDHVLFASQGNLMAQRLDLNTFEVVGDVFAVAEQIAGAQGTFAETAVSTSRTGVIAYRAPMRDSRQLTWFDRSGRRTGRLGEVETSLRSGIRVSPDGLTAGFSRAINGNQDVWLIDTARGVLRRFTSDPSGDGDPVWAPDGDRIAFQSRRSGPNNLWLKRVDGGTEERESADNEYPADWSPDGRFLRFTVGARALWALPIEGDGKPVAVANSTGQQQVARFSPDGSRVAYQANETGRNEIYVVPFPGPGVPMQVSTSGGTNPQWREDGREIFYLSLDSRLIAVPVMPQGGRKFEVGTPAPLFQVPSGASYDITCDGQRILIDMPVGQTTTPPITIIQNWKPRGSS